MTPIFNTAQDTRETVRLSTRSRRVSIGLTQSELTARSGVPLGTLKRFERLGEVSFSNLLATAEVLDAREPFQSLFTLPEARNLDDIERQNRRPMRVRRKV